MQCLTIEILNHPYDKWYRYDLANALASSTRTDSTRKGFKILCFLPSVSSRITRPFPLYLHTASDQILEVGMAWEWPGNGLGMGLRYEHYCNCDTDLIANVTPGILLSPIRH